MINEIASYAANTIVIPKNEADLRTIQIINGGKLTHWSAEDEKRMQTLMAKESRGKWEIIDGVNTKVEVSSEMFSDELKELIAKKENLFEDLAKAEREKELKKIKSKKNPPHEGG